MRNAKSQVLMKLGMQTTFIILSALLSSIAYGDLSSGRNLLRINTMLGQQNITQKANQPILQMTINQIRKRITLTGNVKLSAEDYESAEVNLVIPVSALSGLQTVLDEGLSVGGVNLIVSAEAETNEDSDYSRVKSVGAGEKEKHFSLRLRRKKRAFLGSTFLEMGVSREQIDNESPSGFGERLDLFFPNIEPLWKPPLANYYTEEDGIYSFGAFVKIVMEQ